MSAEPPAPDLIVRPRTRTAPSELPIIALEGDALLETGELCPAASVPDMFTQLTTPSLVVAPHSARVLKELDEFHGDHPNWQFKVIPVTREIYKPNRVDTKTAIVETVVSFFGWRDPRRKASRWFYVLDPLVFAGAASGELRPDLPPLPGLLSWGVAVRTFIHKHQLIPRPSKGGLAGQLLRDGRFWPTARRKVPQATNAAARPQLPGNFYRLYVDPGPGGIQSRGWNATYLDQSAAHHHVAASLTFPHGDTLYARGLFHTLTDKPWVREGTKMHRALLQMHGLLYVNLYSPPTSAIHKFRPPCMDVAGYHRTYVWTNELAAIQLAGGHIESIIAAWVSPDRDPGLNRYAEWCLQQLTEIDPLDKLWVKPLLHTAYGVLAARPRPLEIGYKQAKGGEPAEYPAGSGVLKVLARRTSKAGEPSYVNVIWRGMIEAETRLRSLAMARELEEQGCRVLCIYADAIMVESPDRMPLLPPPWRIETHCTQLVFRNATTFYSPELARIPGVRRDLHPRVMRRLALASTDDAP